MDGTGSDTAYNVRRNMRGGNLNGENGNADNGEKNNGNRDGTKSSRKGKKIVSNSRSVWRHWYARRDMRNIFET